MMTKEQKLHLRVNNVDDKLDQEISQRKKDRIIYGVILIGIVYCIVHPWLGKVN